MLIHAFSKDLSTQRQPRSKNRQRFCQPTGRVYILQSHELLESFRLYSDPPSATYYLPLTYMLSIPQFPPMLNGNANTNLTDGEIMDLHKSPITGIC